MGNLLPRPEPVVGYQDSLNDNPDVAQLTPEQFRDLISRGVNRDLALVPFQMPRQPDSNWTSLLDKKPRPTVVLQSLVGLHTQSLLLVRVEGNKYCVSFGFDALTPVTITIHFIRGNPMTYQFPTGLDQSFSQPINHAVDVSAYVLEGEGSPKVRESPLIITLEAKMEKEDSKEPENGTQIRTLTNICSITRKPDQLCVATVVDQRAVACKQDFDLLEVYGVGEGDPTGDTATGDDNVCVVCTVNPRTVTIFPCRHTYLCATCIDMLRAQTNRCPICRCLVESAIDLSICDTVLQNSKHSVVGA